VIALGNIEQRTWIARPLKSRKAELVDLGEKSIEGTKVRGYRNVATSHVTCNGVPLTTSKEW
jgi:hypothetical protein